jgi:hypothetical protein
METSYSTPKASPSDMSSMLPVFSILGNQLPERMKTPEAKKTLAKVLFWVAFVAIGIGLVYAIPTMLTLTGRLIMWIIYLFVATVLLMLFPVAVKLIHCLIQIFGLKADKAITEKYSIETLRLLLQNVKDTFNAVREKITHVQSVRINMVSDSEKQATEAEEKFAQVVKATSQSAKLETDSSKYEKDGDVEKSRDCKRKASERRVDATLFKSEGDAAKSLAASYAQYANQFGKALEILKDNESSARIYITLLTSSITIAEKKLEATSKMRKATEGLADILQVEDTTRFQWAMEAVSFQISDNIAHVQRNLQVLSESRLNSIDSTKSQEELELFVSQLNSGAIKKLDVHEVSSPYHELTKEEKVDKAFNILD